MLVLGNSILSLHCAAQAAHGVMLRLAGMSAAAVALVSWHSCMPRLAKSFLFSEWQRTQHGRCSGWT